MSLVLIQISKTFCIGFVAILFSYSSFEDGLVLALFVSSLIVVIGMFLACTFLQLGDANAFSLSRHRIWLRKYIEFPLFTTPAVFFSATAQHSPVFIFGALWGDHSAGLYSMVNRLILAPVRLVASAVNKVYLRKVARLRACGIGIYLYTYKLVSKLFLFSFLVTIIAICVLMLDGVSLVLGANWAEADLLALAVLPVFFVGFVSKSVVSFAVIGANKLGFAYQFLLFFTVLFSLSLAYAAGFDLHASIVSLSVSLAFVYLMQIRSILHESKRVSEKC